MNHHFRFSTWKFSATQDKLGAPPIPVLLSTFEGTQWIVPTGYYLVDSTRSTELGSWSCWPTAFSTQLPTILNTKMIGAFIIEEIVLSSDLIASEKCRFIRGSIDQGQATNQLNGIQRTAPYQIWELFLSTFFSAKSGSCQARSSKWEAKLEVQKLIEYDFRFLLFLPQNNACPSRERESRRERLGEGRAPKFAIYLKSFCYIFKSTLKWTPTWKIGPIIGI